MNQTEKLIVKKAVEAKISVEHLLKDKRATPTHKLRRQAYLNTLGMLIEELNLEEEYHKLLKKEEKNTWQN